MTRPRVAVTGYMHEVNALAEPVTLASGRRLRSDVDATTATGEVGPAVGRLRELRDVEIIGLPVWELGASGPLLDADFDVLVDEIAAGLRGAAPLDGVLVLGHGAGRTVGDLDADATFLGAVRDAVGPGVPVVVVLDFHANVSVEMCELADVLVGYRTNPHVDIEERSVEAAEQLHRLLAGGRTVVARCKPPLVLPQLAQNTTPGEPLGDVREAAEHAIGGPIRNVSVFGGFSLADVPDCGLTITVTADDDAGDAALAVATRLGTLAWEARPRYRTRLTPLADAVRIASDAALGTRPPVILADTADNPGGGAPGNTTFVLRALLEAGVDGVVMGLQCDPGVVDAAWAAGEGARLRVEFNAGSTRPLALPLAVDATVLGLVDTRLVPTRGVYRNMERHPGRCCALDLGGVHIAVSSRAVQCADDDTLRHVGLDPAAARVVVVKSRGHFRAGFSHLFADDCIIEVDAPGLAPAVLDGVDSERLPRPVFPLDPDVTWMPHATLHRSSGRSPGRSSGRAPDRANVSS